MAKRISKTFDRNQSYGDHQYSDQTALIDTGGLIIELT